jgi:hypothetical protein
MRSAAKRVIVGSIEFVLAQDRLVPDDWRVEYFDHDSRCYVTVFAGPAAQQRARIYFDALTAGTLKAACAGDLIKS